MEHSRIDAVWGLYAIKVALISRMAPARHISAEPPTRVFVRPQPECALCVLSESYGNVRKYFSQNGGIEAARLAYYEVGAPLSDEELDVRPWEGQDDIGEPAKWIRFDYAHTGLGRVLHMDSHLHISGLPGIRFSVTGIPTPKQFVELVFSHFYPNAYQKMRLDEACTFESFAAVDSINADSLAPQHDLAEVYQRIPHFRVPKRATHFPQ